MNKEYFFFYGTPFSQWYEEKFKVDDMYFYNAEQYMMHSKACLFNDLIIDEEIMKLRNPEKIKALGKKVSGFNDQTWRKYREEIVFCGNMAKFSQNKNIKEYMLNTKDKILVEASPTDTIWGIGLSTTSPLRFYEDKWHGLNLLGKVLMQVRSVLQKSEKEYYILSEIQELYKQFK